MKNPRQLPKDWGKRKARADKLQAQAEDLARRKMLTDDMARRFHEAIGKCYDW